MGMDVYGKKPKSEVGSYFRNNVWYWHPLWDCVTHFVPDLAEKVPNAHNNSGDGLNGRDSKRLGFILKQLIDLGKIQEYVDDFNEQKKQAPMEKCFCIKDNNTDPATQLEPRVQCPHCKGSGVMKNFNTWYNIDVDNVNRFADFLIDCGGFQIC